MKCPICLGELKPSPQLNDEEDYDFDCKKCGRGWRIDEEGTWHSLFSGTPDAFTKEDVQFIQKMEEAEE